MTVLVKHTGSVAAGRIECRCLLCGKLWSADVASESLAGGYDGAQLVSFCACYETLFAPIKVLPKDTEEQK